MRITEVAQWIRQAGAILALASFGMPATASAAPKRAAQRFKVGSSSDASPTLHGPVFDCGGGGTDVDAAIQWMIDQVRGTTSSSSSSPKVDVVVLRATGTDAYNAPILAMNGVNSVETIVGTSFSDFDDPSVAQAVHNAEVVFFAGGNQCDYTTYIKGSATDTAIKYVISKGGAVGGTSAGDAIQGPFIYDGCVGPGATSAQALANPYDSANISFTYGWFAWPHFDNLLCEPHFDTRDRMGRLMSFLARQVKDGKTATAWGMAVSEATSFVVDQTGFGTVMGTGKVYMVLLDHTPETCAPGTPLTCSSYKIWLLNPGDTFDLAHRPNCGYYLGSVTNGTLNGNYYSAGPLANCSAPVITAQPASQAVNLGATATFSVMATGSGLSYQWRKNGANLSGATTASYTTPATIASDNGSAFSVVVANTSGSVTSNNAVLTINGSGAPAITTQPANQTVAAGQTATFSVIASGSGLSYQWRKNGTALSGATSSTYTTPATTSADNGATFSVVVSNASGGATSNNATLTVTGGGTGSELIANGGFESGSAGWTATSGVIGTSTSSEPAYAGSYRAYHNGRGRTYTDSSYQTVSIPSSVSAATLSFYLHIDSSETTTSRTYDTFKVQIRTSAGSVLATLATWSNLDQAAGYTQKTFDLTSYRGQTVQIYFVGSEDSINQTSFVVDNVSLQTR
jgi:cyanophycinase-like exopeptidase